MCREGIINVVKWSEVKVLVKCVSVLEAVKSPVNQIILGRGLGK